MSRPLRLEFPTSLWHITHRGNERRLIFYEDADRLRFLELLADAVRRFQWIVSAYALMPNHYHLVVEVTEDNTLSRGMKWLNGKYVQWFNRRHARVGHLFQGRFNGVLVDKETYFLEVLRYVVLNPVRAKMAARPEECTWTSYRATTGCVRSDWLAADVVLARFGNDPRVACDRYQQFVREGIGSDRKPWDDLIGSMYLGSEEWLTRIRDRVESLPRPNEHPRAQRQILRPDMAEIVATVAEVMGVPESRVRRGRGGVFRTIAAWIGCYEGMLTNSEIAAALRLRSDARVTNLVAEGERELRTNVHLRQAVDRCVATLRRRK